MTDTTAGRGGVGIRLFIAGGELVKRGFDGIADSGKKMWAQIALGERAANPSLRAMSTVTAGVKDGFADLAARAGTAGTALSAFGTTGVVVAGILGGLLLSLNKVREGMAFAAELTDASDRIGIGAESLQAFGYVADEAGVDVEAFRSNLEKLNGTVGAFKVGIGDGKLKPIFEELGITKAQLANVKDAEGMVMLLADTLGQVRDRAVQVRLARGLGVEESLPILRLGSEEIRRLSGEARDLGLVMSDDVRTSFDEADRAVEKAQQRIDMSLRVAVVALADDFATVVTAIAEVVVWLEKLNSVKIPNYGERAGQWTNDQLRRGLGMGPNRARADRIARERGWVSEAGEFNRVEVMQGLEALAAGDQSGFDPKGHTSGGGGDAAARKAEREAQQRRQRQERFDQQLARVQSEILNSYDRGFLSIDGKAAYERASLEREHADRLAEIVRAEREYVESKGLRGLSDIEAEQLRAKQAELLEQKQAVVEWARRRDVAAHALETATATAEAANDLLTIEAQMAMTSRERTRVEREILIATLAIARKRRQAEVDEDPELTEDDRAGLMARFDRQARGQVRLFDHTEEERLRTQFKSYGNEVAQAIEDRRLGEYIGDQLKARLMDGALDMLFNGLKGLGGASGGEGGGWLSGVVKAGLGLFGGGRAGGGETRTGFVYDLAETGRPELFMMGGNGHVTSAAETVRLLRESLGGGVGPSAYGGAQEHRIVVIPDRASFIALSAEAATPIAKGAAQQAAGRSFAGSVSTSAKAAPIAVSDHRSYEG